jgi:hypothetical protein
MRREIFEAAALRVARDLKTSGMAEMLTNAVMRTNESKEKSSNSWISISAISRYIALVSEYSPSEMEIVRIFDIEALADPTEWQRQLSEPKGHFIYSAYQASENATNLLPRIAEALERDYRKTDDASNIPNGAARDLEVQTVILTDEGESLSKPQRVVDLISSVQDLYSTVARLENISEDTLAIVGMDSGSEKALDFLGIAKAIHELRELLNFIYVSVAFHKHNITLKNLEIAGETISTVSKIGKLERDKAISSEEAKRLRHTLFSAMEKFASTGAYTQEMGATGNLTPPLVMRPQPRLLTGPAESIARDSGDETNVDDTEPSPTDSPNETHVHETYSSEQIAAAIKLLDQANIPNKTSANKIKPRRRINPIKKS